MAILTEIACLWMINVSFVLGTGGRCAWRQCSLRLPRWRSCRRPLLRSIWSPFAAATWPLWPVSQGRASQKFLVAPKLHRKPWALSIVTGGSDFMSRSPYRQHRHPPDCFVLTTLVFQQRIQARAWTDYFRKYRNEEMGLKVCRRQVFFFAVSNLGSSMSLAVYLG